MQPFLHQRLQTYERSLESSSAALRAYAARDPDIAQLTQAFLDATATMYRAFGGTEAENEMLALQAQLVSARAGVNPMTLERVSRYRREMERSITLRVLQASAERLRADYAQTRDALAGARELLLPIVSYALQKGLIPDDPHREYSQPELEKLWQAVTDDPDTRLAARQVSLQFAAPDILILLGDLLATAG